MKVEMLQKAIGSFKEVTTHTANGTEVMLAIIECPGSITAKERHNVTHYLIENIDNHFVHAVTTYTEQEEDNYEYGKMPDMTVDLFVQNPFGSSPLYIMVSNMEESIEDCHQFDCALNQNQAVSLVEIMDDNKRIPLSDLYAYYMFIIDWPKNDVSAVEVCGTNIGDYIADCLAGGRELVENK